MAETKKKQPGIAQLTIILFAITAVIALLLGLVNYITEDGIAEITAEKTAAAMSEVMPDATVYELFSTGDSDILGIVQAFYSAENESGECGYVVQVEPSGFGGAFSMVVGIDLDGEVTGISIIKHSETSGLGANATKPEFRDQFKGGSGTVALTKDGGDIDALTGATVTSRAVTDGVNAALDYVNKKG